MCGEPHGWRAPQDTANPAGVVGASTATDILIVDDDPANLIAIEAVLGDLGGRVERARSGVEALRYLLDHDCALILLDVQMPSLDGFETARLIRRRRRSRHTPIIFLTAFTSNDTEVLAAYKFGAVDFLFKPVSPDMLRAKAAVFVDLQRRSAEVLAQAAMLREHERREAGQRLIEERRLWEEEALRRQRDDAQCAARALEHKAEELAKTVAQKEVAEGQLRRINDELAEASRRKDEFLAMLGHELRNPLSSIVIGLEVLRSKLPSQEDKLLDPVVYTTRVTIERQVTHLARLVDDLLDMSRIKSGKIELRRASTTLQELVAEAVEACLPALLQHGHTFSHEIQDDPVPLHVDAVRIVQVISNLLNNACRYTGRGGHVTLVCTIEGDETEIRVSDNGRGIAPELLPHVFDMFVQESGVGSGLGIGLTLVKRLVTLHDGTVSAMSGGADKGSTFVVRLPKARGEAAAPRVLTAPVVRPAQAAFKPLHVVLVEDNADIRNTLEELLSELGHSVRVAEDGPTGVKVILETQPDVALVDIGLPRLDGYGVAEAVRSKLGPDAVRLVAMTGFGQAADRQKAVDAGFDAHLVKPASIDKLLASLVRPLFPAPPA